MTDSEAKLLSPTLKNITFKVQTDFISSKNHDQFMAALSNVEHLCISQRLFDEFHDLGSIIKHMKRFLGTMPQTYNDQRLLSALLNLITCFPLDESHFKLLETLIIESLDNFLHILQEPAVSDEKASSYQDLAIDMVAFFKWLFGRMNNQSLEKFAAYPKFIQILQLYIHHTFASEVEKSKNHRNRINCIMMFMPFTCLNLVKFADKETPKGFISLFVQIVGFSQQNYAACSGDGFTFKDRRVYQLSSLCLRNFSRMSVSNGGGIEWGDHWIFDDGIDWIMVYWFNLVINER
jgi:hypothetical protein